MKTSQLAILLMVVLIGMWAFAGTQIAMELRQPADDHRNLGGSLRNSRPLQPPFQQYSEQAPECYPLESPEDVTMTLVTQVSHDRLWMLKHHCDRYRDLEGGPFDQHPMSIAVYSNATLEVILEELREMNCGVAGRATESGTAYAPVMVSVLDAQTHGSWKEYPVNELRNLALSKVQTTHILYIDVDFWPSDYLYETIMGGIAISDPGSGDADADAESQREFSLSVRQELVDDPKLALVIPAFQLWRQCTEWRDCQEKNLPHMENSRRLLGMANEILKNKSIAIFDPTNKGGHGSTDYKHWFQQTPGTLRDIECLTSNRYEPFVMVRYCKDLPPFQTAFAGYGKNKVTWMMQVIASGYVFSQVGGAYLVHYPHLDSASRQLWNGKLETDSPNRDTNGNIKKESSKRGQIDKLFVDFKDWLDSTIDSKKLQRMRFCEDAQDDDSKLWVETKPSKATK